MQKEGFGFVWKGSWLAFVERIVFMAVRLRSIIWEARIVQREYVGLLPSLVIDQIRLCFSHLCRYY